MLKIDEKYFEDILFENLKTKEGVEKLNSKGLKADFYQHSLLYRQLNLKDYRIPDIVQIGFCEGHITINIIELKVTEFDLSHLLQLGRYIAGVRAIISRNKTLSGRSVFIHGCLIVAGFDINKDNAWIGSVLDQHVSVYSTTYSLDGMSFKYRLPSNYNLLNTSHEVGLYISLPEFKEKFKDAYKYFLENPTDLPF